MVTPRVKVNAGMRRASFVSGCKSHHGGILICGSNWCATPEYNDQ